MQGGISPPLGPEPQGLCQGPGNLNRVTKVGVGSLGTGCENPSGLCPQCRVWPDPGTLISGPRVPAVPYVCPSLPQVDPYLPYEYTCEGMLERIHAYIQHQVGGPSTLCPGDGGPPQTPSHPNPIRPEEGGPPHCPRLPLPRVWVCKTAPLSPVRPFLSSACLELGWESSPAVLGDQARGDPALGPQL